jgi:hypothetical protein
VIKYLIYHTISTVLYCVGHYMENLSYKFDICRDCGRNKYTGKSCATDYDHKYITDKPCGNYRKEG